MNTKLQVMKQATINAGIRHHLKPSLGSYVKYNWMLNKFSVLLFISLIKDVH